MRLPTNHLLRDPPEGLKINDFWFNGWQQLMDARKVAARKGVLGPKQGESVSYYIQKLGLAHNLQFKGEPVMRVPGVKPPEVNLPGGMNIRVLGRTPERLEDLQRVWKKIIEALKLKPGAAGKILEMPDEKPDARGVLGSGRLLDRLLKNEFKEDKSEANGSSIALMLEYDGKRFAALGDGISEDLTEGIDVLARERKSPRLTVAATKLSHHGGKKNTGIDLVKKLRCRNWLISTDGSSYKHPDGESLARVVRYANAGGKPTLHFNYNSEHNARWRHGNLQRTENFTSKSPARGEEGLVVDLS